MKCDLLKDSFKYIVLTVAALLVVGTMLFFGFKAIGRPVSAEIPQIAEPAAASEAPSATPEPDGILDPTPAPTPEPTPEPTPAPTVAPSTAEGIARATLEKLTLKQKIGQLVMFGFVGTNAPSDTFLNLMSEYGVGNAVLYGSNMESGDADGGFSRAKKLTDALNAANQTGVPMLISIDVEGGSVVRFAWDNWPASARTLGRNGDEEAARAQFQYIGQTLLATGVNMNLAPVLDVAPAPLDTFLKTRIISNNADTAARIGSAIIQGLSDAGCLSTAKHFPGHGGTEGDSHETTPVVRKTLDEMLAYDLVPFAEGVAAGVDTVLVAHISYPELDSEHIASQSEAIINGLLREKLGFTGMVMSDDFRMKGLANHTEPGEAAVRFINAGGDLILCGAVPERQKAILEGLTAAVESGELTEARIDESVYRILLKKAKVAVWPIDGIG